MAERALLHTSKTMLFQVLLDIIPSCYHHVMSRFLRSTAFVFSDFLHPGNVDKTKQLLKQHNMNLRVCDTAYRFYQFGALTATAGHSKGPFRT